MASSAISWAAVGAIFLSASAIMVSRNWRMALGALGLQYLAMFLLALQRLPLMMSAAKLVVGWMALAALGMTRLDVPPAEEEDGELRGSQPFRAALALTAALAAAALTLRVEALIPGLDLPVIAGGLILIGSGVVHLGIASAPFRVILGLLTMLTGFELIYSAVENSILVAGMLAAINLSLAFVGSYLMTAGTVAHEGEEEEAR